MEYSDVITVKFLVNFYNLYLPFTVTEAILMATDSSS